jgi:hypothetical protein
MKSRWHLSEEQVRTYRVDGLLASPLRIPADLLGRMRGSLERLLADNHDIPPESLICPHIRSGGAHDEKAASEWFEYATQPLILDLVEQLIGPDIILWGSQVFCKPPLVGREVPWHQDGQYWPIRPLATCSAWIALDDVDAENGCMRFIPGSHAPGSVYAHRVSDRPGIVLNQEVEPGTFDATKARDDVLEAGQFSLHDVYLIHGSAPNRSPRRRAAFVIRYMPATSVFDRSVERQQSQAGVAFSLSRRPIWLLRGQDRTGKNDFMIGHGDEYRLAPRVSDDA